MKRFVFLLAITLSAPLYAQVGYTWVVNPVYDEAGDFYNNLAIVKKNGLYGAIDTTGKEVVPVEFTELFPFTEKVTSFKRSNGKVGIVDVNGKILCEKDYDKIFAVTDSCAKVQKGDYGFINAFGKEIVPCKYGNLLPFSNNMTYFFFNLKYGFYNTKGETVVPLTYTNVGTFSNGLCAVATKDKWGYIDATGKVVIPMEYEDASPFSEGLACVQKMASLVLLIKQAKWLFHLSLICRLILKTVWLRFMKPMPKIKALPRIMIKRVKSYSRLKMVGGQTALLPTTI